MFRDIDKLFDDKSQDLTFRDDQLRKGENILKVQLGSLYYAADFGIDLSFFITSAIQFQNETLRAYIIERLAANLLIASEFDTVIEDFISNLNIKISREDANAIQ
jgi:hypothetical protein